MLLPALSATATVNIVGWGFAAESSWLTN